MAHFRGSSVWTCAALLAGSSAVPAVLLIQHAFHYLGCILGPMILTVILLFQGLALCTLVRATELYSVNSYQEVVLAVLGPTWHLSICLAMLLLLCGNCITLISVAGETLQPILLELVHESHVLAHPYAGTLLVLIVALLPVSLHRSLSSLWYTGILSIAALLFFAVSIVLRSQEVDYREPESATAYVNFHPAQSFLAILSLFLSFNCHIQCPALYSELTAFPSFVFWRRNEMPWPRAVSGGTGSTQGGSFSQPWPTRQPRASNPDFQRDTSNRGRKKYSPPFVPQYDSNNSGQSSSTATNDSPTLMVSLLQTTSQTQRNGVDPAVYEEGEGLALEGDWEVLEGEVWMEEDRRQYREENMRVVCALALSFSAFIYTIIGSCGVLLEREDTSDSILALFSWSPEILLMARMAIIALTCAAFPLSSLPAQEIIQNVFLSSLILPPSDLPPAPTPQFIFRVPSTSGVQHQKISPSCCSLLLHIATSTLLVAALGAIAIFQNLLVAELLEYVRAIFGILVMLVLPAIIGHQIRAREPHFDMVLEP